MCTLRLFWYAIINYIALDTRSTSGLGWIKIDLTDIRVRIYIFIYITAYKHIEYRLLNKHGITGYVLRIL